MSWRNDDTGDGLPIGLPQQEPEACPDGTPQGGAAGEPAPQITNNEIYLLLLQQQQQISSLTRMVKELRDNFYALYGISVDEFTTIRRTFQMIIDPAKMDDWLYELKPLISGYSKGKLIIRPRRITGFLRLIIKNLNAWEMAKIEHRNFSDLEKFLCMNCQKTDGTSSVDLGDIHALITRVVTEVNQNI